MTLECQALIFDLDGVLVDSAAVIEKHWRRWAERYELDPERVLQAAHGRRTVDTIAAVAPSLDAQAEAEQLAREEAPDTDGLRIYDGADSLLRSLPSGTWAIATSGTRRAAQTRLEFATLPIPPVLITAEDTKHGKPDPESFLAAAWQLNVEPSECIVIEDSPAGVEAAWRGGMRTVAVGTTHPAEQLTRATVIAPSIASLDVRPGEASLILRVSPQEVA